MYFKKLKSLLLCTTLTFVLCSCGTENAKNNEPAHTNKPESTTDAEPESTYSDYIPVSIANDELGYRFEVAPKTAELLVSDSNTGTITKDSLTYTCTPYYLNLGGFNQYAFTIYRIDGTHTDEELLNHTPELHPLASNTDYTYAISTAPETPAELSYDDSQTYADILYKEIPDLSSHFSIN